MIVPFHVIPDSGAFAANGDYLRPNSLSISESFSST
jgi:hypothetical protein